MSRRVYIARSRDKAVLAVVLVLAALAVVPARSSGFIYWAHAAMNTIGRANLQGKAPTVQWRVRFEDREEEAMRQFNAVADFLQANVAELWVDPLSKVLEEDGVAPGSGGRAEVHEPHL